ncbi:MAG: SMP-30/gluconolactonase/LRE family protein [Piscirickettsiaceae bacterium]|nr:SMP-30/gluconolactonase/LRE family protein [Piscirickettsiaceae bacterium]
MKILVILIFSLLSSFTVCATPLLVPAWQTEAVFQQPESVVYDAKRDVLLVSNVNGNPNDANGLGYISQVSLSGEMVKQHWLDGLNAPKGLAIVGNRLYVADINELVEIDLKSNKILNRYLAPNAIFLNDVAADAQGNVYVSDMMTNTLHRLANGQFEIWLQDVRLEAPNGLLVEGKNLIVGSWGNMTDGFATDIVGHLKTINIKTKTIQSLGDASAVGNLDGVESDGDGGYFVTDWMNGKLLHITAEGISTTLIKLDQGSADHTVLLDKGLLIIPMMLTNDLITYRIK